MRELQRLAIVAGEASGDLIAGALLKGLRQQWPALQASGIGGERMAANGFAVWWPSERLAVNGYVEVLGRLVELIRIRSQLKRRLLEIKPQLFLGVDAPDFNLALEADLKLHGIKTMHFVCPSIWAWRADRVHALARSVDHVLCVFPFEPALLAQHGIAATYVGHPLASTIPMVPNQAQARAVLGLPREGRIVAILPGSRQSEVQRLAPLFFSAAKRIQMQCVGVRFIVPALPQVKALIEQAVHSAGMVQHIQIIDGQSHAVLEACDMTLIASGTATLEAALYKRPMVISYKLNWLTAWMVRRKQVQPWVGLPNVLCGEVLVPEILQEAATAQTLADAVCRILADFEHRPQSIAALQDRFTQLHLDLQRDTLSLATHAIQQVLAG